MGWQGRVLTGCNDPPVRGHLHPRQPRRASTPSRKVCACEAEMERSSVVLAAGGGCCTRMGMRRASAGRDLVGGIDHGPGSNQPVHHLRMAAK